MRPGTWSITGGLVAVGLAAGVSLMSVGAGGGTPSPRVPGPTTPRGIPTENDVAALRRELEQLRTQQQQLRVRLEAVESQAATKQAAASGRSAEVSPGEDLRAEEVDPQVQEQRQVNHLEELLAREPANATWTAEQTDRFRTAIDSGRLNLRLEALECMTSLCRAEVSTGDGSELMIEALQPLMLGSGGGMIEVMNDTALLYLAPPGQPLPTPPVDG